MTSNKINTLYADNVLTTEEINKYDQNTLCDDQLVSNGNFTSPFNGRVFPQSGDSLSGYYRGITSLAYGESDIFTFYDKEHDNTFVRMANFNGQNGSDKTRISFYYYNPETNKPLNLPATSYINVGFDYRLYASDLEELNLNPDSLVLRFQSRGSASGRSGDVFLKDLIINEAGDESWHSYKLTIKCSLTMLTEYAWFYFFYNDIEPSLSPTYFIDIDNMFASLDENNVICDQGSFNRLRTNSAELSTKIDDNSIYSNVFYKKDYGISPIQEGIDGHFALRMKAKENKSTFSILSTNTSDNGYYRLSFEYKNLSYYGLPNLVLKIIGNQTISLSSSLEGETPFVKEGVSSYAYDIDNGYKKVIIYFLVETSTAIGIDFILDCDCDLAIDNLSLSSVIATNKIQGNYQAYLNDIHTIEESIQGYETLYTKESVRRINLSLRKTALINEYSSQDRMDEVINDLRNATALKEEKGDYQGLREYIDEILDAMAGTNKDDYEIVSYLKFKEALEYAYSLNENSSKEEVDYAKAWLEKAYRELLLKE